jgi:hypothetical protein
MRVLSIPFTVYVIEPDLATNSRVSHPENGCRHDYQPARD